MDITGMMFKNNITGRDTEYGGLKKVIRKCGDGRGTVG